MSEILSNITIDSINQNITVNDNQIAVTPEAIQLNVFTGAGPVAGGSNTNVQFNDNGPLNGSNSFTFNKTTNTTNITNLAVSNLANLGNISNVKISGGTNQYFLQTDGTGNLTWAVYPGNISGNSVPGGANTQIQFNDGGNNFGGSAGFTFDKSSNAVNMPGNLTVAGTIIGTIANANYAAYAGNVVNSSQPNITSVGTLNSLTVNGTVAANSLSGNGSAITYLNAANVFGIFPSVSVTGNLSTTGTTSLQQAKEKVTINATPSTGTINYDVLDQAIIYKTANATSNFTINIRGNATTTLNTIMNAGESITIAFLNTNGVTPYYANNIQIDGSNISVKYVLNNTPTSGTSTGIDQYIYNIVKTASNTYTVLGNKIGFL